jgi:hypothetical protein
MEGVVGGWEWRQAASCCGIKVWRGHRPRVSTLLVLAQFNSLPFEVILFYFSHLLLIYISLFPSPRGLVPNGLSLPVLIPSLASPVLSTPLFLKCQLPYSFSESTVILHWALPSTSVEEAYLLFYFGPRIWSGAEMFPGLGWGLRRATSTHRCCILGIWEVDMVPHAQIINSELPKLFLYLRNSRGREMPTPGIFFG